MGLTKKPGHLFLSTGSEDDGKKPSKNAAASEWPPKAVAILLDLYVKKFAAGRGCLRGKDWEEVMLKVNAECEAFKTSKTLKQCRDKVDSLKRRYKMEKRKAVNGNEVIWPFFNKLDEMMGSVIKQARSFEPYDIQHRSPLYYGHGDDDEEVEDDDDEGSKQGFSGSPLECHGFERKPNGSHYYIDFLENGKAKAVEREACSEDGFDLNRPQQMPFKLLNLSRPQASTDNSSGQDEPPGPPHPGATNKNHSCKKRKEADNPIQALADAVTGFSEVYARVELAKLEIMTNMKLELAKLRGKRRKRRTEREGSRSSSSSG